MTCVVGVQEESSLSLSLSLSVLQSVFREKTKTTFCDDDSDDKNASTCRKTAFAFI